MDSHAGTHRRPCVFLFEIPTEPFSAAMHFSLHHRSRNPSRRSLRRSRNCTDLPAYCTGDWDAARASVEILADLEAAVRSSRPWISDERSRRGASAGRHVAKNFDEVARPKKPRRAALIENQFVYS